MVDFDRWNVARGRRQVIGQRRSLNIAERVINDLFEERITDALGDAAMHLPVGDQRIDDAAGILDRKKALDPNASRLDVDFDLRHVTGIGERAGRIVMRTLCKT